MCRARCCARLYDVPLNISVIGTNYLGAAHAAGMAEFGHRVIGVDIDARRVEVLNSGRSTIFERDLEPMLARHTATGRLRFTTDYREIADWADVHFLAVGTPAQPDGSAGAGVLCRGNTHKADGDRRQVDGPRRYGHEARGPAP